MLSSIIRVAFVGLTIATLESLRRQIACRRDGNCGPDVPQEESTWEGEGGALPTTGSHLGPEPALPGR